MVSIARTLFGLIAASAFLSSAAAGKPASNDATQSKLNIVFIMSDDHAYQAISAYGSELSKLAPTPNIDRIARNGAIFLNSYVTNSLCGPSRATMLTGQYSHVHGFTANDGHKFDNSKWVWPRELHDAGYQTAMFGKWHLNHAPVGIGFDDWKVLDDQGEYYNPDFISPEGKSVVQGYATDLITQYSLDWLRRRDPGKPFALLIHHKAPHRNFMPALRYIQKYVGTNFPVPTNYFDNYDGRPAAAAQKMNVYRDMYEGHDLKMTVDVSSTKLRYNRWPGAFDRMTPEQRAEWDRLHQADNDAMNAAHMTDREMALWKYQRYMDEYLGTVAAVDEGVGKVLDYLKSAGLDRNTIVVYTSDQGFYLGEHGWFDKRFIYEESLRTPLLIQYPGHIRPGSRVSAPVINNDYAPTFLDYAGLPIPASVQGRSLRPVAEGQTPGNWRKDVYYHYYEYPGFHDVRAHYGMRGDRYKLVRFYGDINAWEFYDLKTDPNEMHNRIADPKARPMIARLKSRLTELRNQFGDHDGPAVD